MKQLTLAFFAVLAAGTAAVAASTYSVVPDWLKLPAGREQLGNQHGDLCFLVGELGEGRTATACARLAAPTQQFVCLLRPGGGTDVIEGRQRLTEMGTGVDPAAHPGQRVWVVTHAGVISQLLCSSGISAASWEVFRPGNASITEVSWDGQAGTLLRFDDRSHLAGTAPEELSAPAGVGASDHP